MKETPVCCNVSIFAFKISEIDRLFDNARQNLHLRREQNKMKEREMMLINHHK